MFRFGRPAMLGGAHPKAAHHIVLEVANGQGGHPASKCCQCYA